MLRKFAYNRIFRTTGMLLLLLLLLLFPSSKKYTLEEEKTVKTNNPIEKKEAFLIDKNGYVARCKVSLTYLDDTDYAKKLVELLIRDGKYEKYIPNGFMAILPSDTKINDVYKKDDSIIVDLSEDILELENDNGKRFLEALVYNLTTIKNINNIYVKINGKNLNNIPGTNIVLNQPLSRKNGINVSYDAFNYKDATLTTTYFISENNNEYYYIPVSKITNDKRDKIEIIIDELTSSHIYETNLMSFLNYNTKLINYELKNDILTLNFNNYLFDDVKNKNILEEVIYSISLSVRDNYDVSEVVFTVNGDKITKSVLKNIE